MTDQTFSPEPVAQPVTPVVNYEPGSRLEQLHGEYLAAKAEESSAKARAKAATDALKREMTDAAPGATTVDLEGAAGKALHLTFVETWRFNSVQFKADDPETYVRYAEKSGSWKLEAKRGGV